MNLPNKLTVLRFVLTALFIWVLFAPIPFNHTLALFFFCVASFTDFLDGRIARSRGLITNFWHFDGPARGQNFDMLGIHRFC